MSNETPVKFLCIYQGLWGQVGLELGFRVAA
jgi:hypothetical protein